MKDEALKLALEALENSVDLVREDAYNAEKLYGNYPSRQGKVGGLKVLADDHEKAITAIKQAQALDKMADNARELGLDYEPVWNNLPSNKDVEDAMRMKRLNQLVTPPAQPALVQEPQRYSPDGEGGMEVDSLGAYVKLQDVTTPPAAPVLEGRDWSLLEATQESLREHMAEIKRLKEAQLAVPDAIIEAGESPEFRDGWNECRETMLQMLKARKA